MKNNNSLPIGYKWHWTMFKASVIQCTCQQYPMQTKQNMKKDKTFSFTDGVIDNGP
jgi:hypothetical protein